MQFKLRDKLKKAKKGGSTDFYILRYISIEKKSNLGNVSKTKYNTYDKQIKFMTIFGQALW